jgi:hypothetical protein
MKPLNFWLPMPNGTEQEIIIPGDYVETIVLPAAEHEAGHIIAAHHFGARVLGIAVGFIPELEQRGMFLQALYRSEDWPVETHCIVKAAGPAADIVYFGSFSEKGASKDLADIEELTGNKSLDPYLTKAQEILVGYKDQFGCMTAALRASLQNGEQRILGRLPDNRIGALLLSEDQLMMCLA